MGAQDRDSKASQAGIAMARLTLLAILSALLATELSAQVCEYIKEGASSNCFDATYTCESCCLTDRGSNSGYCWTGVYKKENCCKAGITAKPTPPPTPSPNAKTPSPVKPNPGAPPKTESPTMPAKTASPTTPPPTFKPSTPPPTPPTEAPIYVCPYEKDPSLKCFDDEYYTCKSCCSMGITEKTFVSCWDQTYTYDKCCIPHSEVTNAPINPPSVPLCPYNKDDTCWDAQYTCESCCLTDKSKGFNCWSAGYTKERCCVNPNGVQFQEIPPHIYTPPPKQSAAAACPYNKDTACWGGIYVCEQCCTTGTSTFGTSCWDDVFTSSRCCKNVVPGTPVFVPPPAFVPTPVTPAVCPYDNGVTGCFNVLYPCETCCTTGRDKSGTISCWDATFTQVKCCKAAAVSPPTFVTPPTMPASGGCQDTLDVCSIWAQIGECTGAAQAYVKSVCGASCKVCGGFRRSKPTVYSGPTDSRGLPLDSRGNPILPTRYVRASAPELIDQGQGSAALVIGLTCAGVAVMGAATMLVVHRLRSKDSVEMQAVTSPSGTGTRPWCPAAVDDAHGGAAVC